jgi:hypothetical protein
MKAINSVIFLSLASIILCGCGNKAATTSLSNDSPYEIMYKDSFDILLHSMEPPYNKVDTIYTEMYIALKAMRHDNSEQCANMVCEKVEVLFRMDSVKENQIQYLEAKQIAQSVLKDEKGYIETAYRQYNLYPENSFERLGSLGSLFLSMNKKDSAEFYLNKCVETSMANLHSQNNEIREKSILGVIHGLVLLGKDQEAKDFLQNQLKQNLSKDLEDFIRSFYDDFEEYKQTEWRSVHEFHFK